MGAVIHIINSDFTCQIFFQAIIGYFDLIRIIIYVIQRIEIGGTNSEILVYPILFIFDQIVDDLKGSFRIFAFLACYNIFRCGLCHMGIEFSVLCKGCEICLPVSFLCQSCIANGISAPPGTEEDADLSCKQRLCTIISYQDLRIDQSICIQTCNLFQCNLGFFCNRTVNNISAVILHPVFRIRLKSAEQRIQTIAITAVSVYII